MKLIDDEIAKYERQAREAHADADQTRDGFRRDFARQCEAKARQWRELRDSLPAAGSAELPEPDFALDGCSQPCYYTETVQRIVAALSAQDVSVPRELLADLVSQDHDTRVQAERRLYYALLNGGES